MTERRLDRCYIPSPCSVSWNSMSGTDVTRTCATCARQVHDLSAMTSAAAEALIFSGTERICVRYVRDADGAILTIEGSDYLTDWIPLSTNTVLQGKLRFSDPERAQHPMRFYRVTRSGLSN